MSARAGRQINDCVPVLYAAAIVCLVVLGSLGSPRVGQHVFVSPRFSLVLPGSHEWMYVPAADGPEEMLCEEGFFVI